MAPKTVYPKEDIIQAAFNIFKIEGIENVTPRNIAANLGCSIAPLYTCFKNVDEIKKVVLEKALELCVTYSEKEYTDDPFINIGVGLLVFARDYKTVYRTLFIENNNYKALIEDYKNTKPSLGSKWISIENKKRDEYLSIFDQDELIYIYDKMYIFSHGVAAFLCADLLDNTSDEYFIEILKEMCSDLITSAIVKKKKIKF